MAKRRYCVGKNLPGCMPDTDTNLDRASWKQAREALLQDLERGQEAQEDPETDEQWEELFGEVRALEPGEEWQDYAPDGMSYWLQEA